MYITTLNSNIHRAVVTQAVSDYTPLSLKKSSSPNVNKLTH